MSSHQDKKHQYAQNQDGRWVSATKSIYTHGTVYYCDCPEKHKMKLVKPSGNTEKRAFTDYFAHIKRSHTGDAITCMPCGESVEHRLAKHKLREMQGLFSFVTKKCPSCKHEVLEDCLDGQICIEVASHDGNWRYDCMLSRGDKHVLALEIWHTHATTVDKINSTRARGIGLAEFKASEVLSMCEGARLSNTQVMSVKCCACIKLAATSELFYEIQREQHTLLGLDIQISEAYWQMWNYQQLDSLVASRPQKEGALAILKYFIDNGEVLIRDPRLGEVPLFNPTVMSHVIQVETSDCFPTKTCLVVLLEQHEKVSWSFIQSQLVRAQNMGIQRDFVFMLNTCTIMKRLNEFKTIHSNSGQIHLNNCTWPILKDIERNLGICASCGKGGHIADKCYRKFCLKCGRLGHLDRNCYAKQKRF